MNDSANGGKFGSFRKIKKETTTQYCLQCPFVNHGREHQYRLVHCTRLPIYMHMQYKYRSTERACSALSLYSLTALTVNGRTSFCAHMIFFDISQHHTLQNLGGSMEPPEPPLDPPLHLLGAHYHPRYRDGVGQIGMVGRYATATRAGSSPAANPTSLHIPLVPVVALDIL